jgi:pyrroloquinoline quinone biosynthesis protein D
MIQVQEERAPRRNPTAGFRIFEGQATIVLPDGSYIKVLNEVGSRIWDLIDGMRSAKELASIVAEEFDISPQAAERDVREFLDDLARHDMLE